MLPAIPLKKYFIIPLCLLLIHPVVIAQQAAGTDSLQKALALHSERDTERVDLLNRIAREYLVRNAAVTARYGEEALWLSDSLQYSKGKVRSIRNLALAESSRGNTDKQLQLSLTALKLAETSGDIQITAQLCDDIGSIFTEQSNPKEALTYLHKSLAIKQQQNDTPETGRTLNNIGAAYISLQRPDSALSFLRQAEKIKLQFNDQQGLAGIYENLGVIAQQHKQLRDALRYYELAAAGYKTAGNNNIALTRTLLNTAGVQTLSGDLKNAEENLEAAAVLNSRLKNAGNEMLYYRIRYEVDSARNNYPAALSSYKAFSQRNLDYFNLEKTRAITRSQMKYEAEKKQRENVMLKKEQQLHLATIQQQRVLVLSAAALFLALLLITAMVYRLYKHQQELYRQLNSKNQEVSLQNKIILEQNTTLGNLNQVKDKIFSVISHDLRSPLAILEGLLFLLRDDKIDAQQFRFYSDELWRDVKNTAYMMDNMLQWASNQMKGISVKADDFDLTLLLNQEFELLQTLARQKDLKLSHELNNTIMVYADPDMIRLVLRNLINNAIKFTSGGGEITITSIYTKDMAEVSVTDTGTGIPEEDQHRIFSNIYYSTAGTRNEKGCGLGLHLSKDFVERNHGRIWFRSTPGTGSSFHFTIPLSDDHDANGHGYTVVLQDHPLNGVSVLRN
ncbi:MAG TPA: tetratricopeptide repeat-containing sensor histidine kinase [Chitinophaga sp.]|uniref:ATP-binding protein n=1 Tax=Chitinophaga sp. TaxID=1869181 RepID=UPI002C21D9DE|nr:tetratricopeptide repeat-containing sensor histidine kinase [Chitinophaga sp.]HVI43459.1 tetratricopeptide repeat-containing sensor histidine kinase [Chitinophaga sp.]